MSPPPVMKALDTLRLRLEPLEASHAPLLFRALQREELYAFIAETPPQSVAALRRRYRRLSSRVSPDGREAWLNWALRSHADGVHVGWVQATVHADGTAHVAYVLFVEAWGRGLAREAVASLIAHLGQAWGVRTVRATVDPRNRRSIALLESLGFERGALRRGAEVIHGALADELDYERPVG